ncbi:hypothetical protein [Actinoplanes philippinensis]|nr:hypothetical protein [Actinoplanes philippinensis]
MGVRGRSGAPWSRDQRRAAIDLLLYHAMIEIRALATRPGTSRHPDGHLAEIRLIADVCHNLPGGERPRAAGDHDPLVWTWQTAGEFEQDWMRTRLQEGGFDLTFLEQAPRLPAPATPPATRPTWRRWQLPRDVGAFTAVDTPALVRLLRQAGAPESGTFAQHLHPDARHILRPSRPDETRFHADGPGDLRQYRALATMADGALVVHHPRLRSSQVEALPAGLGRWCRLQLAAAPVSRRERDAGQWLREHRPAT